MKFKDDFEAEKVTVQAETPASDDGADAINLVNMMHPEGGTVSGSASVSKAVAPSLGRDSVSSPSVDRPKVGVSGRVKDIRLVLFGMFALLLFSINYVVITGVLGAWKCSLEKHHSAPSAVVKKEVK